MSEDMEITLYGKKQREHLKQRTAVLNAVGKIFSEMYYINLEDNTIQDINAGELQQMECVNTADARTTLRKLADSQAVAAFRPIMRNYLDYDTIDTRLGQSPIISQEYLNEGGDWVRCSIMPSERTADGRNLSVVYVARLITSEKKELESQDSLIQALAIPYENIYTVNADTGESVCYRMGQIMTERYGHKFAVGDYEDNIRIYIDNDVLEEDRILFKSLRRLKDINELLSDKKTYYFNYRIFRNNEIRYYQCQLVKPSADKNEFVVGFKNIDDEKRQELFQQRRLEETLTELEQTNTALQDEMAISSALSQEYHSLFKIDAVTGKMSTYRTDGIGMDKTELMKLMKLGIYEGGILDRYIASFVAPEDQERVRNATRLSVLRAKVPDKGLYKVEFRRIMNGVSCYYEMNTIKIKDKNNKVTFIMGMRDVDNRVRKERMQEMELQRAYIAAETASKAKTDFLFNMSHDIRTPMNAIIGFTDLLEKHLDDRTAVLDYIKKIKTSNEVLLSLINNVLEMARIESGKEHLDETSENVSDFMQSIFLLFDSQMQEKGVHFIRSVSVEHPNIIMDKTKLREIFLNILSNSLKYTPTGGTVTMKVTELPAEQSGYAVYQTVIEDTGIGMSAEFLPHIFEDFSREHSSTECGITGTGLGTAIVKRLVDLMQGKIKVESELGKGTRFILTMRHQTAGEKDIRQTGADTTDYRIEDFHGKRILLAEDNDLNAEIAITILEEAGFVTERAEDGVICVGMIEKADLGHYDLILMDIQMPNMDGYKATQIIRRLPDKKKAAIPIVAMTANAFEEDRRNALKAGMNGHIAKPIRVRKLFALLAELLGKGEKTMESPTADNLKEM